MSAKSKIKAAPAREPEWAQISPAMWKHSDGGVVSIASGAAGWTAQGPDYKALKGQRGIARLFSGPELAMSAPDAERPYNEAARRGASLGA